MKFVEIDINKIFAKVFTTPSGNEGFCYPIGGSSLMLQFKTKFTTISADRIKIEE